jgi:hypothetical protein
MVILDFVHRLRYKITPGPPCWARSGLNPTAGPTDRLSVLFPSFTSRKNSLAFETLQFYNFIIQMMDKAKEN